MNGKAYDCSNLTKQRIKDGTRTEQLGVVYLVSDQNAIIRNYSFRQQRFPKYSSMSSVNRTNGSPARKLILVVSISRHLHGVPIEKGIESEWAKEKARDIKDSFENVGFNLDPKDVPTALRDLKHELEGRPWDGIIIGWCIRGNNDFTILFEKVVGACCEVIKSAPETKLMFSSGPQNIVETVARNFAVDGTA